MKGFNVARFVMPASTRSKPLICASAKLRSLRAAGVIFFGAAVSRMAQLPVPEKPKPTRTVDHHGRLGRQHASGLDSLSQASYTTPG